jgi:hypothetical protein
MAQDYSNLQKLAQQQGQQAQMHSNPNRPKGNLGCISVIIAALFFVGMGVLVYFWVYPTYFANSGDSKTSSKNKKENADRNSSKSSSLKGIMMNAIIVTDEKGSKNLWILSYTNKGKTYFVNTYIYNPVENEVIKSFESEYPSYPPTTNLFLGDKEVWKVNTESSGIPAGVFVYDAASGEEKLNTQSFSQKYPELQGGISKLYARDNPPYIDFETKDGRKPVFDLSGNKMFENSSAYRNSYKDDKKEVTIFALGYEKSGENERKKLYLVTGPKTNLWEKNISESYFDNPSTLKFFTKSEAKPIAGEKVFLEGTLVYQDDDCCFVFHQTQVGNDAERLLSCIDKTGSIMWTTSTESDLFPKLRANSKDAVSGMFFIKHNVHVMRADDMVLFSYDRIGFIGFDYKTGKKTFEAELSK